MKASPNTSDVLRLIRESGVIHQSDLAKQLKLEKSTISRIVARLRELELVRTAGEMPASRQGGRKPVLLELNRDGAYAVGIDFDIEETRIGLIDLTGEIRQSASHPTPADTSPATILPFLRQIISSFLSEIQCPMERLTGIGVGCPGIIDSESGIAISAVNLRGWDHVPLADALANSLSRPVHLDNSIRAMAIAEKWYGAGKLSQNFLCLAVRFGIGLAIFHQGQLIRGVHNQAGDIHISLTPDGPECYCGRKGCIEAIAGTKAIIRQCTTVKVENSDDICRALEQGVTEVETLIDQSGFQLGGLIAFLTEIFDPERVILSGKLVCSSDRLFAAAHDSYYDYCLRDRKLVSTICKAGLGLDGVMVGAGVLPLQRLFAADFPASQTGDQPSSSVLSIS